MLNHALGIFILPQIESYKNACSLLPPPDYGDCSMKCQNVKNKASGQRAPILDVLAFHAFKSLRGRQKESTGRDARRGRENPLCKFFLEYGQPTTVLKGKLHRYRNGTEAIRGGLLSLSKNSIHTVREIEVINGALLSWSKNFIHTVREFEVIRGGLLS